jgi:hypothetical protein
MHDPGETVRKVAEIIARQLDCEDICKEQPSGCGCSQVAAEAVLLYLASLQATSQVSE